MIKLDNEEDVLNWAWRKEFLKCIQHKGTIDRKNKSLKRFDIYRDNTKKWVLDALKKENLKDSYLQEIFSRMSNISICKKVLEKKAKVYQQAPIREVESEEDTQKINEYAKELDFNTRMSKSNKYLELSKIAVAYVQPVKNVIETIQQGKKIYDLDVKVLLDHMYDPILDYENEEVARGFVLSKYEDEDYNEIKPMEIYKAKRDQASNISGSYSTKKEYIWWTNLYHFTTNEKGEIIRDKSPEDLLNPVLMLPLVTLRYDSDGCYFPDGGDDLVDGCIGINIDLTDTTSIARIQGYGQLVAIGSDIPDIIEVGPHSVMKFQVMDGKEKPTVEFLSSNPPITDWLNLAKTKIAMLLTTNGLSTRNISANLDVSDPASGISQMIENADITFDIEDKQKVYKDSEPVIWEVIRRWADVLTSSKQLSSKFAKIGLFNDSNVELIFPRNKVVVVESEKLDNLKKRKELGISTQLDLIMMDNPDLTLEQAQEKLEEIRKENQQAMSAAVDNANSMAKEDNGQEEKKTETDKASEVVEEDDAEV